MALLIQPGTILTFNDIQIIQAALGEGLEFDGTSINVISSGDITWSVLDILNTPPGAPSSGDIYLVGTAGTGAWSGHNNEIATWGGASWTFQSAATGDLLYDADSDDIFKWTGTAWISIGKSSIHQGGDTFGAPITIGTIDNRNFRIKTNNTVRFIISNGGVFTFSTLTGAAAGLLGLTTAGVASNIQLTTTGSSGAATLNATTLNIPQYTASGLGAVTSVATSNGITGGTITSTGTISGIDAAADGATKGVAAFTAADFNASSGVISIDYANGQKASSSVPGFATSNQTIKTVGAFATGNGTVVPVGTIGYITIPYAFTISTWYVAADLSGSIQFDIKVSGTSIIGGSGNPPKLTSAQNANAAIASWATSTFAANTIFQITVDSAVTPATITQVSMVLQVYPS